MRKRKEKISARVALPKQAHSHTFSRALSTRGHDTAEFREHRWKKLLYAQKWHLISCRYSWKVWFLRLVIPRQNDIIVSWLICVLSNHLLFSLSASRLFCWENNQEQICKSLSQRRKVQLSSVVYFF